MFNCPFEVGDFLFRPAPPLSSEILAEVLLSVGNMLDFFKGVIDICIYIFIYLSIYLLYM